jgi:hypothetical protein
MQPAAPQQPAYGQPQTNPYGQPQANPYGQPGQPPAQNPYGQPPAQNPYGQPQAQNPYGQPQAQAYGQQPNPYGLPQQDLPGPLDDIARRFQSAPGTILGMPISKLYEPGFQRKVLFLAGVALLATIVLPIMVSPTMVFPFSSGVPKWDGLIWPLIAAGGYLLVAAAPAEMRKNVPPIVLQWLPFGISFAGIFMNRGLGAIPVSGLYYLGYATLMFGLLARIAKPEDQIARIIIAIGGGLSVIPLLDMLKFVFEFGFPALFIVHNLVWFVVMILCVLCILFVVPPKKLPPALQAVDALAPVIAAVLLLWLPLQIVLMGLAGIVHGHDAVGAILGMGRAVVYIVAYFGVLMMTSPAAYSAVMDMVNKTPGAPPSGGGYPPQGGGYPPQGGGYPPQQGGGGWQ